MFESSDKKQTAKDFTDAVVRIGLIGFLVVMCVRMFAPFENMAFWALILVVSLYMYKKLTLPRYRDFFMQLLLAGLLCLAFPFTVIAIDEPPPATIYPGLNEVVPSATAVAARVEAAEVQISQPDDFNAVYLELDSHVDILKQLEANYHNWDKIDGWHLNRLLRAQTNYTDLEQQFQTELNIIDSQLKSLEALREEWRKERAYWQGWEDELKRTAVSTPKGVFPRTLGSIEMLLKKISKATEQLIKAQQKYSPGQEIIASRLNQITDRLNNLRKGSFRQNTYTLFDGDYYRQFNKDLLEEFLSDFKSSVHYPEGFFKRFWWLILIQALSAITIVLMLINKKKKIEKVSDEWSFLYSRPFSAALFISMMLSITLIEFYGNVPLLLRWLVMMVVVVATARLLAAIFEKPQAKRIVRTIAIIYILTETVQAVGIPTPFMQLYQILLYVSVIFICRFLIPGGKEASALQRSTKFLIYASTIAGLLLTALGFQILASNLIDATLTTLILFILLKLVLKLGDGGIHGIMQSGWIRSKQFMQRLGLEETTRRLKTLLRVFLLFESSLYLLVIWKLFDDLPSAQETVFGLSYSIGDNKVTVGMVVMVVVIIYFTTLFSWVFQAFLDSQIMTPKKMDHGVKESLKRLTHYGLFSIGVLIAVSLAGLDLQKFTILAGALGVGIGFGLQNIVNNFVSGLILLFERPVKVGDTINIDQDWGTINRIGLRSTIFETFDRSEIIVPNADLVSQKVTNWTFSSKMVRANLPVGVAYGSSLERVIGILNRAASEHPEVISYPEPTCVFVGFGDSSIDFNLRFWVNSVDERLRIRTEVVVIIDRLFREAGITIPFPQRDLHLRSIDPSIGLSKP